jgi:glycine/D-amino acid oxidase-like deaminating enzyme
MDRQSPAHAAYDVVIVGGAIYGSSVAWFLTANPDFDGRILVVERDPSYEFASTSHTNSCIRQQFSQEINVRISRFGADYVRNFRSHMGGDERIPKLTLNSFGYLYLADTQAGADALRAAQMRQAACGAATRHLSRAEIAQAYPFYALDDIVAGNHNQTDEGYFDGATMFDWWKRKAREAGVEYIDNEVTGMIPNRAGTGIDSIELASGGIVGCGQVVNASGPRAALTAQMAGIDLPVEPRKRHSFIFAAQTPLDQVLPLTIDPSGVHFRTDGAYYLAGCAPDSDGAVDCDDFIPDHALWEEKVWPILAHRIPKFQALRLIRSWVGHYAYNTLDQNAVLGPHPRVKNFFFANGFSGHGLQQSPAVGRGLAEYLTYGEYRGLDLGPFGFARIKANQPFTEKAVI